MHPQMDGGFLFTCLRHVHGTKLQKELLPGGSSNLGGVVNHGQGLVHSGLGAGLGGGGPEPTFFYSFQHFFGKMARSRPDFIFKVRRRSFSY